MKKIVFLFLLILCFLFVGCSNSNISLDDHKQSVYVETFFSQGVESGVYIVKSLADFEEKQNEFRFRLFRKYSEEFFETKQLVIFIPKDISKISLVDSYSVDEGVINLKLIDTNKSPKDRHLIYFFETEINKSIENVEYTYLEDYEKNNVQSNMKRFTSMKDFEALDKFDNQILVINDKKTYKMFEVTYPNIFDTYSKSYFNTSSLIIITMQSGAHYFYGLKEFSIYNDCVFININTNGSLGESVYTQYFFVIEVNQKIDENYKLSLSFLED